MSGHYSHFFDFEYLKLWHMCLNDFYLSRTINIIQWCIQCCFVIVNNVKPLNGIRIMRPSWATCFSAHYCFKAIAL